ncbi:MAG: undecaprenyl-phosphate galactose phosphotransferase WbaP [Tepidisphaeraceae bacterium]
MSTGYPVEAKVGLDPLGELFNRELAVNPSGTATLDPRTNAAADGRNVVAAVAPRIEWDPPRSVRWSVVARRTLATLAPLVAADVLALLACGMLVGVLMPMLFGSGAEPAFHLAPFALLPLVLAYWVSGLYSDVWMHSVLELRQLTHVSTVSLLAAAVGGGMMAPPFALWCAIAIVLVLAIVPLARCLARRLCAGRPWWGYPTLIIGSAEGADAAARTLLAAKTSGLRPALMTDPASGRYASVRPVVNDMEALEARVRVEAIRHAIVSMPHVSAAQLSEIVDRYSRLVPHLFVLSDCSTFPALWGASRGCGGISGIEVRNGLLVQTLQALKRVVDIVIALATLLIGLPLFLAIAIAVKLSSRGPVLFGHTRIGRHGRRFKAWKFRTMWLGADVILREHLEQSPAAKLEWGCHQKLRRDPRVTPVGRLLRCTSLDELPQTWNVLVGEMSIVGPRPIISEEIRHYGKALRQYITVKPGITGLWQVSGRNDVTYEQRVQFDLFYIRHWSVWLDIHILARTVVVLIRRNGAY